MNNFGPCTQDCPKRHYEYCPTCEAWLAEKERRLKVYDKRAEAMERAQMTDGGARNCRRAARGKRKMGGAM